MALLIHPMAYVPPEFWVVVFGLLGAILGSYVNMAAYRLPRNISTVTVTRSFCPSCRHQLAWYDNLPVFSFLLLRGRCRYCGQPISARYLIVELFVVALFAAAAWQFFKLNNSTGLAVFAVQLFLIVDLMVLAVADLETWLIPPATTMPWIIAGLLAAPIFPSLHPAASNWTQFLRINALLDSFEGLVLGAGIPWTVNLGVMAATFAWYRAHGSKARPLEGMGAGDSHLLGMVGAVLGWKAVLATFFIGIFLGCFTGVGKILWGAFQRWRLGDKYRPWQPTFDVADEDASRPQAPVVWPLLAMGAVVLFGSLALWQQSADTFSERWRQTEEEAGQRALSQVFMLPRDYDARMFPVWAMLVIGLLLLLAYPFLKYLAASNSLPQGEIVEDEKGEKQEVMQQGHYIPFGPSLAAAALLVAFYGVLIRNFAFWWLALGGSGPLPPWPCRMLGESAILRVLTSLVCGLNAVLQGLAGWLAQLAENWWALVVLLVIFHVAMFLGLLRWLRRRRKLRGSSR